MHCDLQDVSDVALQVEQAVGFNFKAMQRERFGPPGGNGLKPLQRLDSVSK
jgi:hypothetical protein